MTTMVSPMKPKSGMTLTRSAEMSDTLRKVEIVVALWIDEDADAAEVIQEMDYEFTHPAIGDTEIVDINTEL